MGESADRAGRRVRQKLRVVEYPHATSLDLHQEGEVAAAVLWLEAVIIRFYSVEEREVLQSNFAQGFEQYLSNLRYSGGPSDRLRALDWLLTYAIDLEYQDRAEQLNRVRFETQTTVGAESSPVMLHVNLADVTSLLSSFGISSVAAETASVHVEDHIRAACHIIQRRFAVHALYDATHNSRGNRRTRDDKRENSIHGDIYSWMQTFPAGFTLMTDRLTQFAALLRLLYVSELHTTQHFINDLICQLQQVTAAPQTDLSLAQIGR